ncbi:hypothetical protein [Vibrio jasicida]|uniref:hypothetical protein n=1 Tax=Vibrio jasicida TaxID=766224 RepID=UPI000ACE5C59|nr:hypothetical protein [Vibrio jasicida]
MTANKGQYKKAEKALAGCILALLNASDVALDALYYSIFINVLSSRYCLAPMELDAKDTRLGSSSATKH